MTPRVTVPRLSGKQQQQFLRTAIFAPFFPTTFSKSCKE